MTTIFDRKSPEQRSPSSKKRFRIVKLEERVAPGNGGNGNGSNLTCGNACNGGGHHHGGSSNSGSSFSGSFY
jgi:hypothetical protein